ncbi:VWA domain-containing protein [Streptomyces sp. SP17BM10]|uniref:vWA domain-containing protein n=1 Tax=Streptomyces sp. SP17BM10 TaxID=3002530 RepID=UPI002E7A6DA1|nr:vWA domain-containing protein [Streptomyces sp. SP17BM10]MEE1784533.1 VWA domain-containing protein [Streptomyces sp. SP17BM10]
MNPTRTARLPAALLLPTLLLAVLLPALLWTGTARAADPNRPTRAEVYQALGLEHQPADYVILVDTSPSMTQQGRYETVRQTLQTFLSGLTGADHVALYTFDTTVIARYIGAAGDPVGILSRLPAAPGPNGDTDIGAALNAALGELERGDALPIASVVLMTDGENAPAAGSAYPVATTAAWTAALHARAAKLAGHTDLVGYALPLATGATGAQLLSQVVTDTRELVPGSIQDLGSYLQRAGDDTRLRQARAVLAPDLGQGVTVSWSGPQTLDLGTGEATGTLSFTSRAARLPLSVDSIAVSVAGRPFTVSGLPSSLILSPKSTQDIPVRITGRLDGGPLTPRHVEHAGVALKVTGTVGSPWQPALAPDLPLDIPPTLRPAELPVGVSGQVGSAATLPLLIGVPLLVLLVLVLAWVRVYRPALDGVLLIEPAFGEQIPEHVPLTGRRVRLRPALGGAGRVRGRRRVSERGARIDLRIRYSPDGSQARASSVTCAPGSRVVAAGTAFVYRPASTEPPGRPS